MSDSGSQQESYEQMAYSKEFNEETNKEMIYQCMGEVKGTKNGMGKLAGTSNSRKLCLALGLQGPGVCSRSGERC